MSNDSPNALLDQVRDRTDWDDDRRSEALGDLIARFDPEVLAIAVRARLNALGGLDGATLIELVEALAQTDLFESLADALVDQPDLPPDLAWLALDVLEGTDLVDERPDLRMLRDELDDLEEGDDPLEALASQIVDDPDSALIAVEALSQVEPAIRREIIEGLGERATAEPIRNFLRLLAEGEDSAVRAEALAALGIERTVEGPDRGPALVPRDHATTSLSLVARPGEFRLTASAVGPIDGEGRAEIVVRAQDIEGERIARFACDVRRGIVSGELIERFIDLGAEAILNRHDLARVLLGASAWLSGDSIPEPARRALELTLGADLEPRPILAGEDAIESAILDEAERDDAIAILSRRSAWLDDSALVRELAEAWAMRHEVGSPDPRHDPGPFRVLFEGRILGRIDLYRRMLLWSALGWKADHEDALAGSAKRLAEQLGEPQNAVPGHPFLAELMARSLEAAIMARRAVG